MKQAVRCSIAAVCARCRDWRDPSAGSRAQVDEPPLLEDAVKSGKLPPMSERLPHVPLGAAVRATATPGRYGGDLRMLMSKDRDIRMMVVYGYARLVGYDEKLRFVPDILESYENVGDREFTFQLRPGHRWSDGTPFTSDDFRYFWEDVANNKSLSPLGLPHALLVDGKRPRVTFPDAHTVRYAWDEAQSAVPARARGPSPLFLFRPAHYLKQFHAKYIGEDKAKAQAAAVKMRNWAGLHHKKDEQYRFDNPDLPTLEPWINTTPLPTTRFVLLRNPYFHRVDPQGASSRTSTASSSRSRTRSWFRRRPAQATSTCRRATCASTTTRSSSATRSAATTRCSFGRR